MKRKDFFTRGLIGLGAFLGLPSWATRNPEAGDKPEYTPSDCAVSPKETRGPFPNKTPADYVRANIIGDRVGIPLLIHLTIVQQGDPCLPLPNARVDIWHCDSHGKYSEYGNNRMQREDLTSKHFLRGRQVTDAEGRVEFVSIFPGFYRGRAPHIHVEVLDEKDTSLLVTQIAFPEEACNMVYATNDYDGLDYTSNHSDGIFRDSLASNMTDALDGDLKKGYTLEKKIVVNSPKV